MKPYTWEEIAKAGSEERRVIIRDHGLLGAVAVEVARGVTGKAEGPIEKCQVFKFWLTSHGGVVKKYFCEDCPLEKKTCDYTEAGRKHMIEWYTKLYREKYGKKKAKKK